MDGPRGYYAKCNVRQRKTNTVWFHLYMESKKEMNKHNRNGFPGGPAVRIWCFQNCRACVCVCAHSVTSVCNPTDWSLPDSSVHGIFQARTLEGVAISYSRGSSWGIEPVSLVPPVLAGRFFTTVPPGSPYLGLDAMLFVLVLKLFQLWLFLVSSCIPMTYPIIMGLCEYVLSLGHCKMLHVTMSFLSCPRISLISKEPWFLSLENGV